MQQRRLGTRGPLVSALGLGCMAMSGSSGPASDPEGVATIHAALEAGVTMFDTGDFYGMGHNELLLREALWDAPRARAFIAVKFGVQRAPDGTTLGMDGRPASVKSSLAYTLRRLGTDYVDLYLPARVDPQVPIEDTIGAVADLVRAGHVRHVGLSEVSAQTLRRAHAVHPIAAVQIEYSLLTRGIEAAILPTMRELGVGLVAYGVLSRGTPVGSSAAHRHEPANGRRPNPRFVGDDRARNLTLVDALRREATRRGITLGQLAIAWVLSRAGDAVALVGARRRDQLSDAIAAAELVLTPQDLVRIECAAAAGERRAPTRMAALDGGAP